MSQKEDDQASEHFKWIYNLISRLKSSLNNSRSLLSLSFIEKRFIDKIDISFQIDDQQITQNSIPQAIHYAILTYLFTESDDFNSIKLHQNDQIFLYQYSIEKLNLIGYKPCQPCDLLGLQNKFLTNHVNLCLCLEFVVCDKSLKIENFLDDIKRLPRSFFVLSRSGTRQTPQSNLEDVVRLWLSKFPCLYGIKDLTFSKETIKIHSNFESSIEFLQEEIMDGKHIAAVLSRAFPQSVRKEEVLNNDSEKNWSIIREILEKEICAFVPSSFPVSDNLFMCFISDLFHATRTGAKKFVRVESSNAMNVFSVNKISSNELINLNLKNGFIKQNDSCCLKFDYKNVDDDNQQTTMNTKSGTKMIRDSNSIGASIVFKPSKRKNSIIKSSSKTKTINSISSTSSIIENSMKINENDDDVSEFLNIYQILNDSSNFFKIKLSENDVLSLVHSLVRLLHSKNKSEQTFRKLWKILEMKKKSSEQFSNGKTLIREISKAKPFFVLNDEKVEQLNDGFGFSEIDLRASQKVIDFARTMISQSLNETVLKKVMKDGFSIATQTSSMTHYMSFVRESKRVKVTAYVNCKKSLHHKKNDEKQIDTKCTGTQTDFNFKSKNGQANWKKSSNVLRFETVSYPYGESQGGFSRPNSGCYSSFKKSLNCNYSSFVVPQKNGKKVLIRNFNQNK